jgi:hypothetical protein
MRGRKRYVTTAEAPARCPGGRWGPRRVRTNECWALVRAEDLYSQLLKTDPASSAPGAAGEARFSMGGREFFLPWEVRANAVWRSGRLFLICPQCRRRCTRAYVPTDTAWLACRRCWGLTYVSKALLNYKDSLWGRGALARMFGTTQREWAYETTAEGRLERYRASCKRWEERRRARRSRGRKAIAAGGQSG